MEQSEATNLINNCIHEFPAPCSAACPFELDLRSFLKKCSRGRWPAAYREFRTAVVFPSIIAALCPGTCRAKCQRNLLGDDPLDVPEIEKAVIRLAGDQAPEAFPLPEKENAVAVIGAGPAGLSLALHMARKKYPVTVYEAEEDWGGSLRQHPDFPAFDADFRLQFSLEKVTFRFGTVISDLDTLSSFSAVYIATGKNGNSFGLKESWNQDTFCCGSSHYFLGGELCGLSLIESVAAGSLISQGVESVIQTGKVLLPEKPHYCSDCRLVPDNAVSTERIVPSSADIGYSKDEAKSEAARCFQCDCSACLEKCELLKTYRKAPLQMAMEVFADVGPHFLAGRTMTRESYSCNQCGYCESICPTGVNMGSLFQLSKESRTELGIQPAALHEFWLQELDFTREDGFYTDNKVHQYLFFPGCQLTELRPNQVLDTFHFLQTKIDAGILLGCCGAPAVWAADKKRRDINTEQLRKVWSDMGHPMIITACASCSKMLHQLAPEMETVSLYEILAGLNAPISPLPFPEASIFDPCSARNDIKAHDSVMLLAEKSGCKAEPLPDGGKCCGYGGHIRLANPDLYKLITDNRASESDKPYIVYCANCLEVFRSKNKACAHVLDAIFGDRDKLSPTLSEKRKNVLYVKDILMKETENSGYNPEMKPWGNIQLVISSKIRQDMEDMLILDEDLQELIFKAESDSDYFADDSGQHCASLIRPVIVYWAEYVQLNDGRYEIVNAYCHRMHFGEEQDA